MTRLDRRINQGLWQPPELSFQFRMCVKKIQSCNWWGASFGKDDWDEADYEAIDNGHARDTESILDLGELQPLQQGF